MNNRTILILILGLLSAIGPFSIDTYLSGFPSIATDLNVTVDDVSYSLSSFFIGISVGQLIYGPLLDRFGRKTPLIIGLVIYFLASVGCALATSIEMLIALRFLQALGGCVGMVAPRAIVRDSFPVEESAKIFSTLILILGVSPIIAPTVGSYMITAMGWHSVFWLQAGMGFLLFFAVIFRLAESKQADQSISLKPQHIIPTFFNIFKNPQFFTYAFAGSMVSGGVYAYLSGSPFVFMKIYKVTEQQYGWIFGLLAGGLILSSQLNNLALRKYRSEQIVRVVLTIQTVVGILLCLGSVIDGLNLYTTILLIFIFLCCQGFSFPNSSALSLVPFSKEAGSASALLGAIQMGIGSLAAALVGFLSNGTSIPMTAVMAGCAVLGLTIFRVGRFILEKNNQ
ncbi:DHA1 family bicyclomycin/chloramphenicol resistance-like MFS transporter [Arcicella aurantiaca]|uniref:DHA1 family bicyclomycin/chloramphenicol resistance-like MFS transporter n=1 Tax=Arcicella aurantiaca TaxID=591202 RepID=A0A316EDA8_9BACT|nr:multidrug effflux MFS transporter [Arcicella aurantiaca]PWK27609.1 DHA1 family bicyclomycin/chloramphenicol resistance-like MFS transporter [Arcicella aurantiaca]